MPRRETARHSGGRSARLRTGRGGQGALANMPIASVDNYTSVSVDGYTDVSTGRCTNVWVYRRTLWQYDK
jgi:hypothetical protein